MIVSCPASANALEVLLTLSIQSFAQLVGFSLLDFVLYAHIVSRDAQHMKNFPAQPAVSLVVNFGYGRHIETLTAHDLVMLLKV